MDCTQYTSIVVRKQFVHPFSDSSNRGLNQFIHCKGKVGEKNQFCIDSF